MIVMMYTFSASMLKIIASATQFENFLVSGYGMQGRLLKAHDGNGQTPARSRQALTTSGLFRVVPPGWGQMQKIQRSVGITARLACSSLPQESTF
jgi:hypothetical protein